MTRYLLRSPGFYSIFWPIYMLYSLDGLYLSSDFLNSFSTLSNHLGNVPSVPITTGITVTLKIIIIIIIIIITSTTTIITTTVIIVVISYLFHCVFWWCVCVCVCVCVCAFINWKVNIRMKKKLILIKWYFHNFFLPEIQILYLKTKQLLMYDI